MSSATAPGALRTQGLVDATDLSGLNLNLHVHVLCLDGVFVPSADGGLAFVPRPPSQRGVEATLLDTFERIVRLLRREGLLPEDAPEDPLARDAPLLAACYGGAVSQQLALGPDRGRRVVRLGHGLPGAGERVKRTGTLGAQLDGFDLNAAVAVGATQRARLEHLVRYCARAPFGAERLDALDDGRYLGRLKRPWSDGTEALRFDPVELTERIAALIPPPRQNLVRYHGVLTPNAKLRAKVIQHGRPPPKAEDEARQAGCRGQRERWSELMRRTFGLDVLSRDRCGGRLEPLATITDPRVAPTWARRRSCLASRSR